MANNVIHVNNVNRDQIARSGAKLFDQEYHIINPYLIFCPVRTSDQIYHGSKHCEP